MYCPAHFEETRVEMLQQLTSEHPLATVVRMGPDGVVAGPTEFFTDQLLGQIVGLRLEILRLQGKWKESQTSLRAIRSGSWPPA